MAPKATGRLEYPQQKELTAGPEASGCEALHPVYENGVKLFHDPPPALIVQDEAHLLDESLGSFAGLFESALDAIFTDLAKVQRSIGSDGHSGHRRRAKVIAASATVADPERQLSTSTSATSRPTSSPIRGRHSTARSTPRPKSRSSRQRWRCPTT